MFGCSADAARASCSKRSTRSGGKFRRQHLDCHGAVQPGIVRAVDLAHATDAKERLHHVRSKTSAAARGMEEDYYIRQAAISHSQDEGWGLRADSSRSS